MTVWRCAGVLTAAICLLGTLGVPRGAEAAARTLEAVGAVAVRDGDRSDPRERAVRRALREAVWRVAEEQLVDAILIESLDGESPAEAERPDLDKILGTDMVAYTTRYKVLEDRGIGPAMFVEEAGATMEYVVVAEVVVEADLIRERLTRAGLLEPELFGANVGTVKLEVEGLLVYPALTQLRELLVGPVGAQSAVPLYFERGRAVIAVATPLAGPDLVIALERVAPPNLAVVPLAADGGDVRIAVRWTPLTGDAPANGGLPPVESGMPNWAKP